MNTEILDHHTDYASYLADACDELSRALDEVLDPPPPPRQIEFAAIYSLRDGPLSYRELSDAMNVEPQRFSLLLRALLEGDYVERYEREGLSFYRLTKRGQEVCPR
jgi:DNA-binding transcriptional ArsR family regulator